ncbi:MAG: putative aminohydrolase SsnA [Lachnospiraceae bacterium]|nr:putative aminohydrolase SsnA [Lachnospiraceae bacterium]
MILIGNGTVITRNQDGRVIPQGAVVSDGALICDIGDTASMKKKYRDAEWVDAKGGVIMPGLINLHDHAYSAFARGMSIDGYVPKDFCGILEGMWWKMDRAMNNRDTYYSGLVTWMECIRNGVTTVFDHHASYGEVGGSLFELSRAADLVGLRTCLCYEVSDRDGKEKAKAAIRENAEYLKYTGQQKEDFRCAMMGMHASFTLSDQTLSACLEAVGDGCGCHIHVAEGLYDARHCRKNYGKSIVSRLQEFGVLGEKTIAAHCIHIDPEDEARLKETDTMVVHNPQSNMGNAVGCADIPGLAGLGTALGIGTDGYTQDMLESGKASQLLIKHNTENPAEGWGEATNMLFAGNRELAGRYFKTPLGVLQPGAAADVIVLDYHPYTPLNENNTDGHLLFGTNGHSVVTTMAAGKIRMRDRILVDLDEVKLLAEARSQAQDLWKRVNAGGISPFAESKFKMG